ncbi:MAG: hypothetical protein KDC70_00315 [Saprospiraceae bacterium]|nr:hypothetical protein [Saprospiraceae bacterium]
MPIIYKVNQKVSDRPIRQEVEMVGWPNLDADGDTQYDNKHFTDEGVAWDALIRDLEASVAFYKNRIEAMAGWIDRAKDELEKAKTALDNAKAGKDAYLKET